MLGLYIAKKLYIKLFKFTLQVVYNISLILTKTNENLIIMTLYRTDKLEGNLLFVYKELKNQFPEAKIHLVQGENKMNLKLFKEVLLLSRAKYLILDDYYLPIYLIKPGQNLKVIQLWHAAGAFKKFGHSTIGTKFGPSKDYLKLVPVHSNYTHVYISSKKFIDYYAEAFNMSPKKIYAYGIPRIDFFNSQYLKMKTIKKLKKENPVLNTRKVKILFAPTYRAKGNNSESAINEVELVLTLLEHMNSNVILIFKPHPYVNCDRLNNIRDDNFVLAKNYEIIEWMLICDALVTDYSSVIFDFSLLRKPFAHFVPDLTEYKRNRGFYQNIDKISDGPILMKQHELIDWINNRKIGESFDTSRMIEYNFDYTSNVTSRIVSHFLNDK